MARTRPSPLRVRPWRGRDDIAECAPIPLGSVLDPGVVREGVARARSEGFVLAVTPAMPPYEWRPWLDAGFDIRERLHLLGHDLFEIPDRPAVRLRRAGRRDRDRILAIDHEAFEPFWRLDADGLLEAAAATPSSRLRIDRARRGYALFGRAGLRGYVQRLAVHPSDHGSGVGSALVVDGLHWLRRWRADEVLVNTQESNDRALELYERLGFRRRPGGLAVLEIDLTAPS